MLQAVKSILSIRSIGEMDGFSIARCLSDDVSERSSTALSFIGHRHPKRLVNKDLAGLGRDDAFTISDSECPSPKPQNPAPPSRHIGTTLRAASFSVLTA